MQFRTRLIANVYVYFESSECVPLGRMKYCCLLFSFSEANIVGTWFSFILLNRHVSQLGKKTQQEIYLKSGNSQKLQFVLI